MQKVRALFLTFIDMTSAIRDVLMLGIRLWMANVFWVSGVQKFNNWDTTVLLFTDEHPVPFLPPEIAAFVGTGFELLCPVMLVLGLGSRLATLPLLVMTAVIQFTYLDHVTHIYWMFLLATILCYGSGKLSLDHLIAGRYKR